MKLPSGRRGELGTKEVAVPFGSSCTVRLICPFGRGGKENDRRGDTRAGEYCPDRKDGSLLMEIGDGREARRPREDDRRVRGWVNLDIREGEDGGAPPVSDSPSSII